MLKLLLAASPYVAYSVLLSDSPSEIRIASLIRLQNASGNETVVDDTFTAELEAGLLERFVTLEPDPAVLPGLDSPARLSEAHTGQQKPFMRPIDPTAEYQFLHIGKTGGSSLVREFGGIIRTQRAAFVTHLDSRNLTRTCSDSLYKHKYIFFVRSPLRRFVSGWISRYRQYNIINDWEEMFAFRTFRSPNHLGCALGSKDKKERHQAERAINGISHTAHDLAWYWNGWENLKSCGSQIFFTGRVEHFDEDTARLHEALKEQGVLHESNNNLTQYHVHSTDRRFARYERLGECAVKNLKRHYLHEYAILRYLRNAGHLTQEYLDEIQELEQPDRTL